MNNPTPRQIVLSAFAADSFALGAHWEYDTQAIKTKFGRLTKQADPLSGFHSTKRAGDQTHIGDTAIMLLESIVQSEIKTFDAEVYRKHWMSRWETHKAYRDHATTATIENWRAGKTGSDAASDDDDMSHAAKFFPLLAVYTDDEELLAKAARALVSVQQRGENQIVTGEFLARVAYRVLHKRTQPTTAVEAAAKQLNHAWLCDRVDVGRKTSTVGDLEALRSYGEVKQFGNKTVYTGLSCSINNGLPALVHYLYKYENTIDPCDVIIDDVNIGGNSNARSIALATMLFSWRGVEFPQLRE